jgi:hypothetical protein
MSGESHLPKPEIKGSGEVLYRCAECGELMLPESAVIIDGQSFHPTHVPENKNDGS